jgi:site-specific DNA-cytosine methylase
LQFVLNSLVKEGYSVTWNIMRTEDHGVPHSRARLYVVAMLQVVHRFEWPQTLKAKHNVERFLDEHMNKNGANHPWTTETARRSWRSASAKLRKRGVDYNETCCFVDVRAAASYTNINVGKLPCLTAARGAQGGFYITTKHRMTTIQELGRLQGWRTSSINKVLDKGASNCKLGRALGNGMSVNVLYRLLPRVLWSAGLLEHKTRDVFKTPPSEARGLSGFLPDALYDVGIQGNLQ